MPSANAFEHGRIVKAARGRLVVRNTSPNNNAVKGVCGAGFRTIGFPAARQGATLWATKFKGKLNGVMPRIGPSGNLFTVAV